MLPIYCSRFFLNGVGHLICQLLTTPHSPVFAKNKSLENKCFAYDKDMPHFQRVNIDEAVCVCVRACVSMSECVCVCVCVCV